MRRQILLAPLSGLYSVAVRVRASLYESGFFPRANLGVPVISVGNLTTGGTGKTPLVEWLARKLAGKYGRKVCILTRGYGRKSPGRRVVVSDSRQILAGAEDGGDEPRMLAESLIGIAAVVSDANRTSAGRWAIKNLGTNVFILDDGFQHLRIERNLDLVTIDSTNPFGNKHLLPRGHLREPRSALARADCIILTRTEVAGGVSALRATIQMAVGEVPILASHMGRVGVKKLSNGGIEPADESVLSLPMGAFCGLANPTAFFMQLRKEGVRLNYTRAFPDHHCYSLQELDRVAEEAAEHGAEALITTAKDAVKLRSLALKLPCYILEIEIRFDEEEKLLTLIERALQPNLSQIAR